MSSDMPSTRKKKKPDQWDIERAADTLIEAEEIKADGVLYPLAKKELKKKVDATNKAAQLAKVTAGLHKAMPGEK